MATAASGALPHRRATSWRATAAAACTQSALQRAWGCCWEWRRAGARGGGRLGHVSAPRACRGAASHHSQALVSTTRRCAAPANLQPGDCRHGVDAGHWLRRQRRPADPQALGRPTDQGGWRQHAAGQRRGGGLVGGALPAAHAAPRHRRWQLRQGACPHACGRHSLSLRGRKQCKPLCQGARMRRLPVAAATLRASPRPRPGLPCLSPHLPAHPRLLVNPHLPC